jgi:hypothetical protein
MAGVRREPIPGEENEPLKLFSYNPRLIYSALQIGQLFLVALGAFGDGKSLFPIMACTTGFAGFHVIHSKGDFLHLKKLRLAMTICTLGTCIRMGLSIKDNFPSRFFVKLNLFARAYRQGTSSQTKQEKGSYCNDQQSFHITSPSVSKNTCRHIIK